MAQRGDHIRFVQQIRDHLLAALQLRQIAQRLQNPGAQFPAAHGSHSPVERGEQAHVSRAAGFHQLEIHLRGRIEQHVVVPRVATQGREMIHFPPQLLLQIMNDRARRADRCRHVAATETIERFDAKMLAQREARVVRQEGKVVISEHALDLSELRVLPFAHQHFRRGNPREIVQQRAGVLRLGYPELPRAQLRVREPKNSILKINRAEIIRAIRFEQVQLAHCSRRDDLRDLTVHDFSRLRFAGLIADRDSSSRLDEFRDIILSGVIRHAAHRHAVAMGEREIEQTGRFLRVVEKELVEIAQAKEQQRVRRHARAQPLVLLHHWSERVRHALKMKSGSPDCEPELFIPLRRPQSQSARRTTCSNAGSSARLPLSRWRVHPLG